MAEQQTIREVAYGSPEYWATVALRDAVLRKPLGLQLQPDDLAADKESRHVACYRGDRLVGCLMLQPLAVGDVMMRWVPGTFAEVTGYRGGGRHGLAPGEFTDDSSMALALAKKQRG